MITITFLGTVSGIPSLTRNHASIVLEYFTDEKEVFLFDCGEGAQKQLMKSGVSFMDIDKIFITHWHADHFAGLIPLIQTMNLEKRSKPLTIYAPEAERFVSNILDLGYFGLRFPVKTVNVPFEGSDVTRIDEGEDYEISSIPVLHTVPAVAFCFKEKDKWNINEDKLKELGIKKGPWLKKLKKDGKMEWKGKMVSIEYVGYVKPGLKVVYSGDTAPCDNVIKISRNADLLIHDGTFLEEDVGLKAHADVKEAAKLAKKAGVKQLILTHISRRYTDTKELEDQAREIFPDAVVAKDMMKISLKKED
ncbi:MAG: ribonuclease Z [Candidatus Aenigmarchaeota archaeon CG_4_10_14_0_8_um_filter_37_24]|nr:ribonuclease Z [Candidatus Aenigmarchaeota archaeon]NCS71537.1 ribonuclease Z [Candidatus Aenigmarchaeota archaeon]OIN88388.1 MAG: ribonuclease Z [Candidatus Aenigmarchaeota archaeon CG1_02_38_14]PIY36296.1 MAG: ribonuclease Z [Candidatus Aenigmarchaeota archaeon CG_4_10_14_3_um_filter_37_21]PIZ35228.1 MAG: ribonuclease Z [Candidatus Aenigmarchaeota archaeon CG_4_10_14_0_8_um_filter_37_24]